MSEVISHPFSPIISEERLQPALEYVAGQSLELVHIILGDDLSIDTICFFTHSPEEYEFLETAIRERGPKSEFSHGPTLYVKSNFMVLGQHIKIFGVRQPDNSRPQVGYGDYPVSDYKNYQSIAAKDPYMTEITSGLGKSLIELRHPDFDVLGFIVDSAEHKT